MFRIKRVFLCIIAICLFFSQSLYAYSGKIVDIVFDKKNDNLNILFEFDKNVVKADIDSQDNKIILKFSNVKLLESQYKLPNEIKKMSFEIDNNDLYVVLETDLKVINSYISGHYFVLKLTNSSKKNSDNFAYSLPPEPKNIEIPFEKKQYTGKKISLDLQDADVRTVFRMLSEIGGVNIVLGEDIKGTITLKLKDVPWDQVLDIVLAKFGLGKAEINGILYIAPINKLQKQVQEIKSLKSSLAETQELGPVKTEYINVNYVNACDLLNSQQAVSIKSLLTQRGTITCDSRTNILIVKDTEEAIKSLKSLIKKIDVPTKQVLIEARIVEVSSNFARNLGVRWYGGFYSTNQETSFNLSPSTTNVETSPAGPDVDLLGPIVDPGFVGGSLGNLGILLGHITKTSATLLDLRLSALEQQGLGKIVSAPVVITRDNGEAVIKQGYQIPYLELTSDGTATTKFINADLTLKVTPHILPNNEIRLEINIDKSEPDWARQVNSVPAIMTRQVQTYVRVPNNGTVVIGGLKISKKQEAYDRVPGLSKIPGAGNLFKNSQKTQEDQELLIFITAKVVSSAVADVDY
ncbi:type IV pilus secretin PilQ [Thermodesulfatator indicus DSM 15286]|uniref:Type IV pilus secretin PilQ n=1 Tax=Thermodesulfatator indicus (strain DSM 15286 / JCM 11887 / CIR29812) TaxID=667014 RepID=F8AB26_THEID|nr:type IV pilus secretin PilQ [Thermodesulfatator indicus]AEH44393.1 type IV pilus secretin PilQ [Thermodesulfatator indicus DSM 15286]